MEAAILFILVLGFLFLGVPISISLGLSSVLAIAIFSNDSISSVALQLFTASQNYTLLAIPFFILASAFMSTGVLPSASSASRSRPSARSAAALPLPAFSPA